ncbi:UNVERIFIED_CONTAM: DUF262 domain-containing protein [Methylobacteriaceae bacterium AG10]|nr:DUF262 domain-containing protein [Methylobacteriaceae bacterium AG10]
METTATNRRLRELLTEISNKTLIPRPEFQRRLVWVSRHKIAFIKTVLEGLPFPEIYIAAGEVNLSTGQGTLLLVDGQQRLSTLHEYFRGSPELRLGKEIPSYAKLHDADKKKFLEYSVVVRDLGALEIGQIKEVFQRINSTQYSLNAMEIDNARFDGELKLFAEEISKYEFFEETKFFGPNEIRRMGDLKFILSLIISMISGYFNRDDTLSDYLEKFNDEFPEKPDLERRVRDILSFIRNCQFPGTSRFWKKADFFSAFIEFDYIFHIEKAKLDPLKTQDVLTDFYNSVDRWSEDSDLPSHVVKYARSALQATNDRSNRIARGTTLRDLLGSIKEPDNVFP